MSGSEIAIPMQDLALAHEALEPELLAGLAKLLASGRFVQGEPVRSFEAELARYCGAPHAVGCNSGTDAIWLALRALDIGPGDAVVCPGFSFFASAATLVRLGARPIFCDILPGTLNLDPEDALRRAGTDRAWKAVLSVDLFGRLCELGPLEAHCRERGIPIVEDAAQSIGARDASGAPVGGRARVACLSFYPTKNLGALGDAGGVITADGELAARIARLRAHGESAPGLYDELGINSRLDSFQAMALSIKLRHLDRWTEARRALAAHYDALLLAHGALTAHEPFSADRLAVKLLEPAAAPAHATYHRYVVRIAAERRDGLIEALRGEGIGCEVYYPRGLHQQPALAAFAPAQPLIEVERATRECLALPLYPELGSAKVEQVVETLVRHLSR
ncbi:MAG: DegT/DnrJ/EryC1/StrS family aminotransferase [Deltaproteobacteria bacterium]|nr:DegT/DnrJ/EryC1/StrS family aminotransferase [Deltaproteobacteria bacterium]